MTNHLDNRHPLDAIFAPDSVAVIGATESHGSVGRTILRNLLTSAGARRIFPVNPHRRTVLGVRAYPSVGAIPDRIDLAVIATPARTVPAIMRDCARVGVRGVIIISAGFKEIGRKGAGLEEEIRAVLEAGHMRLIGPNCLGVMRPYTGLNATFAASMALPGSVAFISQSGALCTAILDWSFREQVGFSAFISVGSMLDVGWGDLISYLGDDPHTKSIVIYMESIGNPHKFLTAAREIAPRKPIIILKAGRTEKAALAATSHTGTMTGSDAVLDAAFRRAGVLRVNNIAELFYMAEILSKQRRPDGPRLAVLTNAGGPGVLAADALLGEGGVLAELEPETIAALDEILPEHWSHDNPVDILGDADPERYARAFEIIAKDNNSDGILVIHAPQGMSDPGQIAEKLTRAMREARKPVLVSWMGGSSIVAGEYIFHQYDIPTFPYPDTAARVFNYMWRYSENLRALYETPTLPGDWFTRSHQERSRVVSRLLSGIMKQGRTLLTEKESKDLLAAYDIATTPCVVATTADDAGRLARELGFPVVLKLHSRAVTHKSDIGGVKLNLTSDRDVKKAFREIQKSAETRLGKQAFEGVTIQPMIQEQGYELILGSSTDVQFGPVLLFGAGGQFVEVFEDRAHALPPLNTKLARRLIERTKVSRALSGARGRGAIDWEALESLMVKFSQLVIEQPRIKEVEVNPLLALPAGRTSQDRTPVIALDARVILHEADIEEDALPRVAIRPYPVDYIFEYRLPDGQELTLRPIRPEDEPLMVQFHQALSDESVYMRFFHTFGFRERTAHERLARLCFIDYDQEIALVAEKGGNRGMAPEIVGVGRLMRLPETAAAEFGLVISDGYQRRGLGTEILRRLIEIGRREKLSTIVAEILPENRGMLRACEKLGFQLRHDVDLGIVKAKKRLDAR